MHRLGCPQSSTLFHFDQQSRHSHRYLKHYLHMIIYNATSHPQPKIENTTIKVKEWRNNKFHKSMKTQAPICPTNIEPGEKRVVAIGLKMLKHCLFDASAHFLNQHWTRGKRCSVSTTFESRCSFLIFVSGFLFVRGIFLPFPPSTVG